MGIVLFRLDERLIHGQVVVAWGEYLHPDRFIIFNDQIATSPWERELYTCCVPPEFQAAVFNLEEALQRLRNGVFEKEKVIALVDNPADVLALLQKGAVIPQINIGGMHYRADRNKILPYLSISPAEAEIFSKIIEAGTRCLCQDVPQAAAVNLQELLSANF